MKKTYQNDKDRTCPGKKFELQRWDDKGSKFEGYFIQNIKEARREYYLGSSNQNNILGRKVRKRKYVKKIVRNVEQICNDSPPQATCLTPDKSIHVKKNINDLFDQLLNSSTTHNKDEIKSVSEDFTDRKDISEYKDCRDLQDSNNIYSYNNSSSCQNSFDKDNVGDDCQKCLSVINNDLQTTDFGRHELVIEKITISQDKNESISKLMQKLSMLNKSSHKRRDSSSKINALYRRNRLTENPHTPETRKTILTSTPITQKRRIRSIYKLSPIPVIEPVSWICENKNKTFNRSKTSPAEISESSHIISTLKSPMIKKIADINNPQIISGSELKNVDIHNISGSSDKSNPIQSYELILTNNLLNCTSGHEPFHGFSNFEHHERDVLESHKTVSSNTKSSVYLDTKNGEEQHLLGISAVKNSIGSSNSSQDLFSFINESKRFSFNSSKTDIENNETSVKLDIENVDSIQNITGSSAQSTSASESFYDACNTSHDFTCNLREKDSHDLICNLRQKQPVIYIEKLTSSLLDKYNIKLRECDLSAESASDSEIVNSISNNSINDSFSDYKGMKNCANNDYVQSQDNYSHFKLANESLKFKPENQEPFSDMNNTTINLTAESASDFEVVNNKSNNFINYSSSDYEDVNYCPINDYVIQDNYSHLKQAGDSLKLEQEDQAASSDNNNTPTNLSAESANDSEIINTENIFFINSPSSGYKDNNNPINDYDVQDNCSHLKQTDKSLKLELEDQETCSDKNNTPTKPDISFCPDESLNSSDDSNLPSFVTTRRRNYIINDSAILDNCDISINKAVVNADNKINHVTTSDLLENNDVNSMTEELVTGGSYRIKDLPSNNENINSPFNITTDEKHVDKFLANRIKSITVVDNDMQKSSKPENILPRPSIVLQPGKKWERSLSIYRRMTSMNLQFDLSMLEEEPSISKGRNYRQSVIATMEMQDTCSLHNDTYNDRRSTFETKPRRSTIKILKDPSTSILSLSSTLLYEDAIGFLSEDCDDTLIDISNLSISDSRHDITILEKVKDTSTCVSTARDYVLRRCNQSEPILFDECYPDTVLKNCHKIGEGVYGEVFLWRGGDGRARVMKVVPIAGNTRVNGENQKDFNEIISEIVIAMELSALRAPMIDIEKYTDDGKEIEDYFHSVVNATNNFNEVLAVRCVYGHYPARLLDLWELYDESKGSENDNPTILPADQQYIVLELANAGQDLESYQFNNAQQAYSLFHQVAFALAVAEEAFQFEHRDLHWGNILIAPTDQKFSTYLLRGRVYHVPCNGVQGTIIDYSLSRLSLPLGADEGHATLFNDLATDEGLFDAVGDYQFEVYRLMKEKLGNDWKNFDPYTNVLWLHYTVDKMITALRYKRTNTKIHKHYISKLKDIKDRILEYESVVQFVLTNNELN